MLKTRKNKRTFIFFVSALTVFGAYFGYQIKNYFAGPKIFINNLPEWSETGNGYFEVSGGAENISEINFNGKRVYTDKNGVFKESLMLAKGVNLLRFTARDKFGRETTKDYFVVFNDTL